MAFRVYIDGTWTIPPTYAMPVARDARMQYAPVVLYPPAAGINGVGLPIMMELELRATIGRPVINQEGQAWWYSTVGLSDPYGYAKRYVTLYDPMTQAWVDYYGTLWRPTYGGGSPGLRLFDFVIQITGLIVA